MGEGDIWVREMGEEGEVVRTEEVKGGEERKDVWYTSRG